MICSTLPILRAATTNEPYFRTLKAVELLRDSQGEAKYFLGNNTVVFVALIGGVKSALRCYTIPNDRAATIYGKNYLPQELFIPSEQGGLWVDLCITEWCEGITLNQAIEQALTCGDKVRLTHLSRQFNSLALELLGEEWAHGDISCDNIIVDSSGDLSLIDFDGCFLPTIKGELSIELGTQPFQHPARTENNYDRTIDDYPIALISTALTALALDPSLATTFPFAEGLLYDPKQAISHQSQALNTSIHLFEKLDNGAARRVATMLSQPTVALPEIYRIMRYIVYGIHPTTQPHTPFYHNGMWGYLNSESREVIPPIYDAAHSFRNGKAKVRLGKYWHELYKSPK